MKHVRVLVTGKVQGVSFRMYAKAKADELGVVGFVRNEAGGGVYIEVEGEEQAIDDLIAWCGEGPRFADVTQVQVEEGDVQHFKNFSIR